MASVRETAIGALVTALEATGATVWRDTDLTRDIPDAGMINVSEADYQPEVILSPLTFLHEMPAEVTATIVAPSEPERDAAMDVLLLAISAALTGDRTLGGAVEWLDVGVPGFIPFEANGAAKSARLPVTLCFTSAGSPLA